jgi:hypothetical protein
MDMCPGVWPRLSTVPIPDTISAPGLIRVVRSVIKFEGGLRARDHAAPAFREGAVAGRRGNMPCGSAASGSRRNSRCCKSDGRSQIPRQRRNGGRNISLPGVA